jgi:hypothetical protein
MKQNEFVTGKAANRTQNFYENARTCATGLEEDAQTTASVHTNAHQWRRSESADGENQAVNFPTDHGQGGGGLRPLQIQFDYNFRPKFYFPDFGFEAMM